MKKDLTAKIFMYVLGAVIVIGFFTILGLLIYAEIHGSVENVLYMMLGTLVTAFGSVVHYHYGTSQGSKDKTDMMAEQAKKS